MSNNLGSFGFDVSVSIGAAQANLERLAQSAEKTAQQVQQAFKAPIQGPPAPGTQAYDRMVRAAEVAAERIRKAFEKANPIQGPGTSGNRQYESQVRAAEVAAERIRRAFEKANPIQGPPAPGTQSYDRQVRAAEQAAERIRKAFEKANPVQGPADPSSAAGRRELSQFQREQSQITVRTNFNEVEKGFDQIAEKARALGNVRFNLSVDADGSKKAEAAVERMGQALRNAKANEVINLNVQASTAEHADATVKRLTADINAAKAAGARVNVNVQTNAPRGGFLQQAGGGFLQQITPGLATGAAATAGVVAAQGVVALAHAMAQAVAAGVNYNAMLERSGVQLDVFTGSGEVAQEMLAKFRQYADVTPFSTDEVVQAGAALSRLGGTIDQTMRRLQLAGQLAAVNPDASRGGGLEGATVALTEARSGDFTSLQRRFNVSPAVIQGIKALGLNADETAEKLVTAAGGSDKLVAALGDTFEGRVSTAGSALDNLGATASKPIFDALSAGLARFTASLDQDRGPLEAYAAALGKAFAANPTGILAPGGVGAVFGAAAVGAVQTPAPAPATGLSPEGEQQQGRIGAANAALEAGEKPLRAQNELIKANKDELERIQLIVKQVTAAYQEQLRPLEQQQRALQARARANDAQQRSIDKRIDAAGPSTAVRAKAAFDTTVLDHDQEVTDIRHRQAELVEQLAKAEQAAADRVAEAQIRGAERVLQATQARAQAENQARQIVLEGIREEAQARQQARQDALEGMREYIQAAQEARREALDAIREEIAARQEQRKTAIEGLQEEIRVRREGYDDARTIAQEANRDRQEAFEDQQRTADRGHQRVMDHYRDQIESLRDQTEERKVQSKEAEKALDAFNQQDKERQRGQTLRGAENSVLRARTGAARRDALEHLADLRADQAADRQREALQAKVADQQKTADDRRSANADKISALERKSRDEDRVYQQQKDAQTEAFRVQQRQTELADRAAEKAEREVRRNEDNQVRALEKADREQTKIEQAQIKAAEKADQAQTKAENAQIRAQEKSDRAAERADQEKIRTQEKIDRDADRAAQAEILRQQQVIQNSRNALSDRQEGAQTVLDAAALGRLREQTELEHRRIAIRQTLADATNVLALAQANYDKVVAVDARKVIDSELAGVDAQIAAVKARMEAELGGLNTLITDIENKIAAGKIEAEKLQTIVDGLKKDLDAITKNPLYGPVPPPAAAAPTGPVDGPELPPEPTGPVYGPELPPPPHGDLFDASVITDPNVEGSFAWALKETARLAREAGAKAKTALWDAFVGAGDAVAGAGAGEAFAAELGDEVPQAITDSDVGAESATAVSSAFSAAATALGQQLGAVLQSAWGQAVPIADAIPTEIGKHLADGITAAMGGLDAKIGTALGDALNAGWAQAFPVADAIGAEIATHIETSEGMATLGTTLGTTFQTALQTAWAASVELVDSIGTEISKHVIAAFSAGFADQQQVILDALAVPFSEESIGGVISQAETVAAKAWEKLAPDITTQSRPIIDAIEEPFIEVDQRFWPEVKRKWKEAGKDHADAYYDGWDSVHLATKISGDIRDIIDAIGRKASLFKTAGKKAGDLFEAGFCEAIVGMANCVATELKKTEKIAEDAGKEAGRKYSGGFASTNSTSSGTWDRPVPGETGIAGPGHYPAGATTIGGVMGGQQPQRRAMGGRVDASREVLVGEDGPELVSLDTGGYVHTASETRRIMAERGDEIEGFKKGGKVKSNHENAQRLREEMEGLRASYRQQEARAFAAGNERMVREIQEAMVDASRRYVEMVEDGGADDDGNDRSSPHHKKKHKKKHKHRMLGGPLDAGDWSMVGEGGPELIRLRSAGAVMPAGLTAKALAGTGTGTGGNRSTISVTLNQTIQAGPGMDTKTLAQLVTNQAVAAIIDVLDDGSRRASGPISRILPGAV